MKNLKEMFADSRLNGKTMSKTKGGAQGGNTYRYGKRTEKVVDGYIQYDQGELIIDDGSNR